MSKPQQSVFVGVLLALALVPPLVVAYFVARYGVALPLLDQWDTPGSLLYRLHMGDLQFQDLFRQHNEARKAFSSLVWMGLAVRGWDARIEMAATVLLTGACVLIYGNLCRRQMPARAWALLVLAASASLFHPYGFVGHPSSWLWGVNLENALTIAALLLGVMVNVAQSSLTMRFVVSVALSVAATYTFANGLALWVLLYPRLYPRACDERGQTGSRGWIRDGVYWTLFALVVVTYFHGFEQPPNTLPLSYGLTHPEAALPVTFAWLGAPLTPQFPWIHGALGLGLVCAALWSWCVLDVARRGTWRSALPFLIFSVYGLMSAAAVGLGRSGGGLIAALATRYHLHTPIFLLGLNGLLWLRLASAPHSGRRGPMILGGLVVAQITLVACAWRGVETRFLLPSFELTKRGEAAFQFSALISDNPDLGNIHPHGRELVKRYVYFIEHGVLPDDRVPPGDEVTFSSTPLDLVASIVIGTQGDRVRVTGQLAPIGPSEGVTHLLLRGSAVADGPFFSVLPLAAYPRDRGTGAHRIDAWVSTANFPDGIQRIELLAYRRDTHELLLTGVMTETPLDPRREVPPIELGERPVLMAEGGIMVDGVFGPEFFADGSEAPPRLEVHGWAFDQAGDRLAARVYVRIGDQLYPALYLQPRPDVAKTLGRPYLIGSGYQCRLPVKFLDSADTVSFDVVIETAEGDLRASPQSWNLPR